MNFLGTSISQTSLFFVPLYSSQFYIHEVLILWNLQILIVLCLFVSIYWQQKYSQFPANNTVIVPDNHWFKIVTVCSLQDWRALLYNTNSFVSQRNFIIALWFIKFLCIIGTLIPSKGLTQNSYLASAQCHTFVFNSYHKRPLCSHRG